MRKSQVTVFVIIGLLVVIIIAVAINQRFTNDRPAQGQKNAVLNNYIEECSRSTVYEAEKEFGLKPELISGYVTDNMPECLNLDFFTDQGFVIEKGMLKAKAQLSKEVLVLELDYPLKLIKEDTVYSFDNAIYTFPQVEVRKITYEAETILGSPDNSFIISIPAKTSAILKGENVEELSLTTVGRDFNLLGNWVLVGQLAYEASPDVTFSKPVTLTLRYLEKDIPNGMDESQLVIGYFNDEKGIWIGLPTEVDTENNVLRAKTTHFSSYGPVFCVPKREVTLTIPESNDLITMDCEPCNDPGWINEEVDVKGETFVLFNQNEIEFDLCKSTDICGPICYGDYDLIDTTDVFTCENQCAERKGNCEGNSCRVPYYGYKTPLEVEEEIIINFDPNGKSCINVNTDDIKFRSTGFSNDITDGNDIEIALINADDNWEITQPEIKDAKITFKVKSTNDFSATNDACLPGHIEMKFSGFDETYKIDDPDDPDDPDNPDAPDTSGEPSWTSKPREPCSGADTTSQTYYHCNDFSEYDQKTFTVPSGGVIDTRRRQDFCDKFGDFPYEFPDLSADVEFLIFNSAHRDDQCWLLVEAQQTVIDHKPDMWVKKEQVDQILDGTLPTDPNAGDKYNIGYKDNEPKGKVMNVKVVDYYTPLLSDFKTFYNGEPTDEGSSYYCDLISTEEISFYADVKCQGSGAELRNGQWLAYRYSDIETTKEASPTIPLEDLQNKVKVKKTLACPHEYQLNKQKFYLDYGTDNPWTGCYECTDTGSAKVVTKEGKILVDLYVGIGYEALAKFRGETSKNGIRQQPTAYKGC